MIDLDKFAHELNTRTHHRVEDWFDIHNAAIHDPAFSQMTDGEINHLVEALISPEQLHWLMDFFRNAYTHMTEEMPFDFLVKRVSMSEFSLREWLEALHIAYQEAQAQKKPEDLPSLVKIVGDFAKSHAQKVKDATLPELVRHHLNFDEKSTKTESAKGAHKGKARGKS